MSNKEMLDYWTAIEKYQKDAKEQGSEITRWEAEVLLKKKLIERLRAAIDALENSSGSFPGIYDCDFDNVEGKFAGEGRTMETVSVTLSYPWGG